MTTEEIIRKLEKKRFVTRGLPLTKKMWRDGYNKCLDEVILTLEESNLPLTPK